MHDEYSMRRSKRLVVPSSSAASLLSTEHVHSTTEVHLLLFLLLGLLFSGGPSAGISGTSSASSTTASPAPGGRNCDDLRELFRVAKVVGENDGVERLNFVPGGLEKRIDLFGGNVGLNIAEQFKENQGKFQ
jgi:hypothetical protein